jgi:hypothetical protein
MKKLFSICLLILCLSLPVFGGHTQSGGYYCTCGYAGCILDPGECGDGNRTAAPKDNTKNEGNDLSGIAAILLVLLLLGYRIGR